MKRTESKYYTLFFIIFKIFTILLLMLITIFARKAFVAHYMYKCFTHFNPFRSHKIGPIMIIIGILHTEGNGCRDTI